ncbi:MAG: hypothetical protein QXK88_03435 [Desulfurococcaceae archaeon]
MVIRYKCKHCGQVLYEFKGVGQSYIGVPTPIEVVKLIGYICPSCKKTLDNPSRNFKETIVVKTSIGHPQPQARKALPTPMMSHRDVVPPIPS